MEVGEKVHEVGLIGTGGGWCKCFQRGGAVIRPGRSTLVALFLGDGVSPRPGVGSGTESGPIGRSACPGWDVGYASGVSGTRASGPATQNANQRFASLTSRRLMPRPITTLRPEGWVAGG